MFLRHKTCACFLTLAASVLLVAPVQAEDYGGNLSGDWSGARTSLSKRGIEIEAIYTADFMSNLAGGLRRGSDFLGNVDVTATFDGEKLFGLAGSTIFLYFLNNHGGTFDATHVGSVQGVDNIETGRPHTSSLYEAWIEQAFFDDRFSVRAGLYDLNSEFYVTDSSGLFLNSTFGIGTEFAQSGVNGPSIFPTTSLAARVKWQPDENAYVMAAVLDGVPGDPDDPRGTQISLGNGDGALVVAEASYDFNFVRLALGGWYYSSQTDDLLVSGRSENNRGIYALAEKEVFDRGTVFARLGFANPDVNQTDFAWATGLVIDHVFKSRENSQFGIAVSGAHNSDAFRQSNPGVDSQEIGVELTYSDQITPWLRIQPDIQYTINPGTVGTSGARVRDSLVIGSRFEIIF